MADLRVALANHLEDIRRQIPRAVQAQDPGEFWDAVQRMNPVIDELQIIVKRLLQTRP
jgi:hypothetical protein